MSVRAYGEGDYSDYVYGQDPFINVSGWSYGTSNYGENAYGSDVLPAVVNASASITCSSSNLKYGEGSLSVSSSISILAGFTANVDGTASATATVTSGNERVREASATVSASASSTARATATFESSATVNATASLVDNGAEVIIREDSDQRTYGSWNYGVDVFDEADLQTIVIAQATGSSATANRVQNASATVSASSSSSSDSERIHIGEGTVTSTSTIPANAVIIANASATVTVTSTITFTSLEARIRESGSIVTVESAEVTNAREKWERISRASTLWEKLVA